MSQAGLVPALGKPHLVGEPDTQIIAGQSDEHYGSAEGKVLEALPF